VNISRAVKSLRRYTDCLPLIEQRALTPEDRGSATELVRGHVDGGSKAAGELMVDKVVDLQPGKRVKSPRQLDQEIIPFLSAQAKTAHKAEIARLSLKTEMALDSARVRSGSVSFSIRVESFSGIDSSR